MRRRHRVWRGVCVLAVAACVLPAGCDVYTSAELRAVAIEDIDLARVADGTYEGSLRYEKYDVAVAITVQDGQIGEAKVTRNGDNPYAKRSEAVLDRIYAAQTPLVDVVSGATVSSKAIMKAAETALRKGLRD